jgi:hypothetical protein
MTLNCIWKCNLKIEKRKPDKQEMFNLRNKACQEAFKDATDDNPELLSCFENNLPVEVQSNRWIKCFNSVLHKSFRKVRIVNNKRRKTVR